MVITSSIATATAFIILWTDWWDLVFYSNDVLLLDNDIDFDFILVLLILEIIWIGYLLLDAQVYPIVIELFFHLQLHESLFILFHLF